jgi:hypothetical protein
MSKTILEVYSLAVCFVTISCFAITLGVGIYDVVQFTAPEFSLSSWDVEKHLSNESYTRYWSDEKREKFSDEEITNLRTASYHLTISSEKRDAIHSFIMSCIIILIDIIIFFAHWKVAQNARYTNEPYEKNGTDLFLDQPYK